VAEEDTWRRTVYLSGGAGCAAPVAAASRMLLMPAGRRYAWGVSCFYSPRSPCFGGYIYEATAAALPCARAAGVGQ
jgi:hypothetical protein